MIRHLARHVHAVRQSMQAGGVENRLQNRIAKEGSGWDAKHWRRALRNLRRLNRIAYGKSPWHAHDDH